MRAADLARLLLLAVIWSASFVFVRVLAPVLGPVMVATGRVAIAGVVLVVWLAATGIDADVRRHWRAYLLVGVLNSALPFLLFAYAALTLPASYLAILNAVTPLFGALAAAIWIAEPLTPGKLVAFVAGIGGVALVSGAGPVAPGPAVALAVAASLCAALFYALSGIWLKRRGAALKPAAVAGWSQLAAGIVLLPLALATLIPGPITAGTIVNLLLLSLVCSGIAYLLYYRLIVDIGPVRALTVTFLIPVFGIAWGALLLHETITLPMIAGTALILAGTIAVLRPGKALAGT
jgi:drug/metabolite transporter (DMT)-like permease